MKLLEKFFKNVNKAILAAGALAVAIGAIVLLINQLRPPPPAAAAPAQREIRPHRGTPGNHPR